MDSLQIPFDHAALLAHVEELCRTYPKNVSFNYLGNSILGRGIPLLSVGHGPRQLLYIGTHHGMEWITSCLLMHFLSDLCLQIADNRTPYGLPARFLTEICTIHVVPMLNPDGVEYQIHGVSDDNPIRERLITMNGGEDFSRWQANARGVDLNHNYDADFWEYRKLSAENGIVSGGPTRFAGEMPESEPEVASLCNFIRYNAPIAGVLTLHTQGEEIYIGGSQNPRVERIAARLSRFCGYKISRPEGLASMSGLTDWCAKACKIPAFTIECGRGVNPLPLGSEAAIYHTLRQLFFRFPTVV